MIVNREKSGVSDPRCIILLAFALILTSVSTSPEKIISFSVFYFLVIASLIINRVPIKYIFSRVTLLLPFIIFAGISIFLSSSWSESSSDFSPTLKLQNLAFKSFLTVFTLISLSHSMSTDQFLKGLAGLGIPIILIRIAEFTLRYFSIITDEAMRMKRAIDSRLYKGRTLLDVKIIGNLIGALFLRSIERAERISCAMSSRGFDHSFVPAAKLNASDKEITFLVSLLIIIVSVRFAI